MQIGNSRIMLLARSNADEPQYRVDMTVVPDRPGPTKKIGLILLCMEMPLPGIAVESQLIQYGDI